MAAFRCHQSIIALLSMSVSVAVMDCKSEITSFGTASLCWWRSKSNTSESPVVEGKVFREGGMLSTSRACHSLPYLSCSVLLTLSIPWNLLGFPRHVEPYKRLCVNPTPMFILTAGLGEFSIHFRKARLCHQYGTK